MGKSTKRKQRFESPESSIASTSTATNKSGKRILNSPTQSERSLKSSRRASETDPDYQDLVEGLGHLGDTQLSSQEIFESNLDDNGKI